MLNKKEFVKKIDRLLNEKAIVDDTLELCKQKTINPPGDEYLCRKVLEDRFNEIGVDEINRYEKKEGRMNMIASFKGVGKASGEYGRKKIAIVGHLDVVPVEGQDWQTDPFQPLIRSGRIYARGVNDNKGPLAAVIEGVRIFKEALDNKFNAEIDIIAAADEERGSDYGIRYLLDDVGLDYDYALIPDGGEFSKAVYGEMGILTLEFSSKGKAYHGSKPENGKNAIIPLSYLATKLYDYDWTQLKGTEDFDHSVLNVGLIQGGTAMNIVPDKATMNGMWRYPVGIETSEIEKIVDQMIKEVKKKYQDAEISIKIIAKSIPFVGSKKSALVRAAIQAAEDLNINSPDLITVRGETVAKFINQKIGCEVLVNGPEDGSIGIAHQPNESIALDSLKGFAKYYAMILYNIVSQNS